MTTFEEEYLDVLQNIEAAIVGAYRGNGELTDYEVDKALNALWMEYRADQAGKTAGPVNYERARSAGLFRGENNVRMEVGARRFR